MKLVVLLAAIFVSGCLGASQADALQPSLTTRAGTEWVYESDERTIKIEVLDHELILSPWGKMVASQPILVSKPGAEIPTWTKVHLDQDFRIIRTEGWCDTDPCRTAWISGERAGLVAPFGIGWMDSKPRNWNPDWAGPDVFQYTDDRITVQASARDLAAKSSLIGIPGVYLYGERQFPVEIYAHEQFSLVQIGKNLTAPAGRMNASHVDSTTDDTVTPLTHDKMQQRVIGSEFTIRQFVDYFLDNPLEEREGDELLCISAIELFDHRYEVPGLLPGLNESAVKIGLIAEYGAAGADRVVVVESESALGASWERSKVQDWDSDESKCQHADRIDLPLDNFLSMVVQPFGYDHDFLDFIFSLHGEPAGGQYQISQNFVTVTYRVDSGPVAMRFTEVKVGADEQMLSIRVDDSIEPFYEWEASLGANGTWPWQKSG